MWTSFQLFLLRGRAVNVEWAFKEAKERGTHTGVMSAATRLAELKLRIAELEKKNAPGAAGGSSLDRGGMSEDCSLCGRPLNVASDPLSDGIGWHCWGCMGKIEADLGAEGVNLEDEIKRGLRFPDGSAKPPRR